MSTTSNQPARTVRHFLEVDDLSSSELAEVLDRSEEPQQRVLDGRGVALVFEKPSLRTRNSSEMAVVQLGGFPVYIQNDEITLDKRERTEDAILVLEGYYDIICARVFEQSQLERMASVSHVPIINLLSNSGHPVQALADALTIRQEFGTLRGLTMAWVGDFSNVALSLGLILARFGSSSVFSCPEGYGPTDAQLKRIVDAGPDGTTVSATANPNPAEAVKNVHIVSTDAWYSMGQEDEKEIRRKAFAGYRVDSALLDQAKDDAIFLHCLPAHRGEEVTDEAIDGPRSRVFPQAHNRMHTMRGLFAWLHAQGSLR